MNSNIALLRLRAAFALLVAMVAGLGWFGLHCMDTLNDEVNVRLEKHSANMAASQQALMYSSLNNRIVMQLFSATNRTELGPLMAERTKNSDIIIDLIHQIQGRIDSPEEKALLAEIERSRGAFLKSYTRAITLLVDENRAEEAHRCLTQESLPLMAGYLDAWQAFVQYDTNKALKTGADGRKWYRSAREQVLVLIAAAAILAAAIAFFTARAVAREISRRQKMQDALRKAGEQLEERVRRRTQELSHANSELLTEIEQRKQAETALREIETRFRAIFEGSNDAEFLMSPNGFYDCNPCAVEMFALASRDSVLGLAPKELSPEKQPDGTDSDSATKERVACALRDGHVFFEWLHQRMDGTVFPAEVMLSSFQIKNEWHIHANVRDITKRKKMETALAVERDRFQSLMDFTPDVIYFKDKESRFVCVNRAFARRLGFASPEDLVGKSDFDIYGKEHSAKAFADEQRLMQTGEPIIDLEEREDHKDGRITWVSSTKVPLRDVGGRITGIAGVSRNITERKNAELALLDSASKYQRLIESVSDWVWEAGADWQLVYSNPKVEAILGRSAAQIVGRPFWELLFSVEKPRILALMEDLERADRQETIFDCVGLHKGGKSVTLEMNVSVMRDEAGRAQGYRGVARDATERRRLEEELRSLTRAVDQSPASVVITDTRAKVEYVNARFCEVSGYAPQELLGRNPNILKSGKTPLETYQQMWKAIAAGKEWRGEFCNRKKNGELFWESLIISALKNDEGSITHYLAVKEDITERKRMEKEREILEIQLRQAQKLESVGQLAAGIAHEINTPIQYIGDNLRFIRESFEGVSSVISADQALLGAVTAGAATSETIAAARKARSENDIDYLLGEIPTALEQSLDGVKRVADIVRAMKEFSHPAGKEKTAVDINHCIQTTITVARNEWKYVAELVTDLAPGLPLVQGFQDEINQVILNLLVNAAQAIGDAVKTTGGKGTIKITTKHEAPWVEIRVADTGTGIPEEIRHRIFELFFTTKEPGKGTGQGLALARSVIVKKHGGELTFESAMGKGTTFIVRLPVTPAATA